MNGSLLVPISKKEYAKMIKKPFICLISVFLFFSIFVSAESICQYANNAEATHKTLGFEAIYATGVPDSDGNCSTVPIEGKAWKNENWNIRANVTFTFQNKIYPNNITFFGDFDFCLREIWVDRDNAWYLVWVGVIDDGMDDDCKIGLNLSYLNFKTNKVKIQTCGWSWSAIDTAQICGLPYSFPRITLISPKQDEIINSLKGNVQVEISTDIVSECELSYNKDFRFKEGTRLSTTNGTSHSYNLTKPVSNDSVEIYYKCEGYNGKISPYSFMHRFSFKELDTPFIEICTWYNCSEGAVSFSIDNCHQMDQYGFVTATCREELDKAGVKGTYFLTHTDIYSSSEWGIYRDAYNAGHEIGGHSEKHNCFLTSKQNFTIDTQNNIKSIIDNISMLRKDLIIYAWPCGFTTPTYEGWLSDYYPFARGYHHNLIESKNPKDFLEYRSINTVGIGELPPDYFLVADVAKNHQDWVNYVYHDECYSSEIINYSVTNGLWVDTIGAVSKYIREKNSMEIQNIRNTSTGTTFDLINNLNTTIFDHEITLKIYVANKTVDNITVNGVNTKFTDFIIGDQKYVKFNLIPLGINEIKISGLKAILPYCGDGKIDQGSEECDDGNKVSGDGCSSDCKIEEHNHLYIILYVGNIDGNASPIWYPFFDRITQYYEHNQIPTCFSFFPATIKSDNEYFAEIFKRMYLASNIELVQKGFTMNETEEHIDELPLDQQRGIIKEGRYYYINKMKEILNSTKIDFPVSYVAPFSRFTNDTRTAIQQLGFRNNFGLYYPSDLGPVESTETLDSMQYGVSFTVSGAAGRNETFKQPDQIILELKNFNRQDVTILTINGSKVIPLYVHQPDFEDNNINGQVNETKWRIYNETITRLLNDPNVTFVSPNQVWSMRHPFCMSTGISETFCNNIDDDCDGNIDEDYLFYTCGIGACQTQSVCVNGIESCTPGNASTEICDRIDNDCNGLVDEGCYIYYNTSLYAGWNLISLPLQVINSTLPNALSSIEGNYSKIMTYYANEWKVYDPNDLVHSNLSSINEKIGYWIKVGNNTTLIIQGLTPENTSINLSKGWNLIGYPYLEKKNISELFDNVTVFTYNNSKWYSYDSNKPSYLNTLTKFSQGYGYWVNAR